MTDANGSYRFENLPAGAYSVCEDLPPDQRPTSPDFIRVTLAARQSLTGRNFGATTATPPPAPTGSITGIVFNDSNGDGKQQRGKANLSGRRIYLDLNNDVARQSSEPQKTTDSNGRYRFDRLAAGLYCVRQVLPAGSRSSR
jgi:hypothetical protein